ncbi:MAG: rhodanese-like domain-containing protein [Candidatus Limnocylindrales bacterium]
MGERQTIEGVLEAARSRLERVTPEAALAAMRDGAVLIDTRCAELRLEAGVVPGAVHIPLSVLYWRLDPSSPNRNPAVADLDRQVILLCAHGYSSSLAAATLLDLGFARATDVVGGFEAWAAAGLPVATVVD